MVDEEDVNPLVSGMAAGGGLVGFMIGGESNSWRSWWFGRTEGFTVERYGHV